jgi:hypothetical protein
MDRGPWIRVPAPAKYRLQDSTLSHFVCRQFSFAAYPSQVLTPSGTIPRSGGRSADGLACPPVRCPDSAKSTRPTRTANRRSPPGRLRNRSRAQARAAAPTREPSAVCVVSARGKDDPRADRTPLLLRALLTALPAPPAPSLLAPAASSRLVPAAPSRPVLVLAGPDCRDARSPRRSRAAFDGSQRVRPRRRSFESVAGAIQAVENASKTARRWESRPVRRRPVPWHAVGGRSTRRRNSRRTGRSKRRRCRTIDIATARPKRDGASSRRRSLLGRIPDGHRHVCARGKGGTFAPILEAQNMLTHAV